jgi:hypothetical protein
MANNFDAATDRILAAVMMSFRNNSIMPMLVSRDYQNLASKKGKSVDVLKPQPLKATDVVPSPTLTGGQDIVDDYVPIKLQNWKEVKFNITDKEMAEIAEGVLPSQLEEAGIALADAVDFSLLSLANQFWGVAGVAGQTPFKDATGIVNPTADFGVLASKNARAILNRQLTPMTDRHLVLNVDAEANAGALPQFQNAQSSADKDVITKGIIGEKQGFKWQMNQQVARHVTGASGAYVTSALAIAGSSTIAVSGGAGTPKVGDVIFIAGDSQSYVLKEDSTTTAFNVAPRLRIPVLPGSTIVIVPSHTMNLAFHRKAMALVVRTLEDSTMSPGMFMKRMVDDMTKLPFRLEISRGDKMTIYSVDILWGVGVLRREFGSRVMGE